MSGQTCVGLCNRGPVLKWGSVLKMGAVFMRIFGQFGLHIWGIISAAIGKRQRFLTTSEDFFGVCQIECCLGSVLCRAAGERRSYQLAAGPEISISV